MTTREPGTTPRALDGLRVLEVASPLTAYCGKMFADMGADVILVEPPGGSRLRRERPFIADTPGVEASLTFAYYNTSKRGVTLDLERPQGCALFRKLAADADLVLEAEKPGVMAHRDLGYDALARANQRLVMASITPFGQAGPYSQFEGEDLTGLAMGGLLYLGGYPDSAPTRVYGEQAFLGASMYGAVAAMLALTDAETTGEGQHVDVSMQECMVMAMETAVQFYDLEGTVRKRYAGEQRFAGTGVFECRDGYIYMMAGGIGANKFWSHSLQWLVDEKVPGVERLQGEQWSEIDYLLTEEAKRIFAEVFAPWAKTKTKAELYHEGQRRHIPLAPINTPADILKSAQLAHREYFVRVPHPVRAEPMLMPGAPYKLSRTPWRVSRPAPRLGEHNGEVYGGVGLGPVDLERLAGGGVI
jgi:benzylsuccinate CoA-transferase BbsE subunit